jgi:2-succinyl-6-hydroxy-2,4-cyclohexadiene-1-carboxylate synthase
MDDELVLLHGFTQTGASWEPVRRAVGERYRAHAPDLRGHGSASGLLPATFEGVIEDVASLVERRFTLAGYSMGGRIGLALALARPDRVERLVLVSASPGLADPDEREARRRADEALADDIERSTMEAFAHRWAAQPLFAGQPPEVARSAHDDRLRNSPPCLAGALRGLGTGVMEPLWERLPDVEIPVDLVVGERDEKFRAINGRMAEVMLDARLHVIPGAGHAVHLEKPEAIARLLVEERRPAGRRAEAG